MLASDDEEFSAGDVVPPESWSQCLYNSTSEEAEADLAGLLDQHASLARAQPCMSAR